MKIHSLPSFQLSRPPVAHDVPLLEAGGRVSLHPTPLPRPPSTHHTHDTTCLHGGTSIRSGERRLLLSIASVKKTITSGDLVFRLNQST